MEVKKSVRKTRAALTAGTLAAAIALTGTLTWWNMSQENVNEFRMDKNPGGRMHDDFNGVANKDIYAENFTDEDTGAPVFVRVKFLEYMETGEEAGVNRNPAEGTERKATPLLEGADINDTTTWFLHKPDPDPDAPVDPDAPAAVKDPFHEYWKWDQDGSTIYMPTFNKNKDSITPEVNGTYVGADDDFEAGRPYDDYVTYADGKTVTADAYYDVDGDDIDENYGKDGDQDFSGTPGAGGDPLTDDATDPDYEIKNEEHTAHATLNSLGVMTMDEWKAANGPLCNKWIWDSDGWFYWPQLIQPQTATGLLLDKVTQVKTPSEKCYYAIDMVGQFVSADGDWGTPDPATGFYVDGFTDDAKAMLEKAAAVVEVNGKRYISLGQNLFQEILNDEGELSDYICGGEDKTPNTDDDRTDVLYVEAGLTVGVKDYGNYFLEPRTAPYEPYYRAVGNDGLLGTEDDDRLWSLDGNFPDGILDKIGDTIEVTADGSPTQVEVTQTQQFSAAVMLGEEVLTGRQGEVTWSVTAADGSDPAPGTTISNTGELYVDEEETAPRLKITATSKLDDKLVGSCEIGVIGKLNVKVTVAGGGTPELPAGGTLNLKAQLCRGQIPEGTQPTEFTWNVAAKARTMVANTLTITANESDKSIATLTSSRDMSTNATVTVTCAECEDPGTLDITIAPPATVTLTVAENSGKSTVDAGGELNYTATFDDPSSLLTEAITWSVGTSTNNGATITKVEGVDVVGGKVTVADTYVIQNTAAGDTFYVKADAADTTTDAKDIAQFTILPPTNIEVKVKDGGEAVLAPGHSLQLEAVVKRGDAIYASDKVTWTLGGEGNPLPNTEISETGLLTFDETATIGLTVTATSVNDPSVSGTLDVSLKETSILIEGTIVTYDEIPYIVLTRDTENNRMLILKQTLGGMHVFHNNNNCANWSTCDLRTWLNETWLADKPELTAALADPRGTEIKTRDPGSDYHSIGEGFITTRDKVFLLSEADCFGTINGKGSEVLDDDYTAGGPFKWPGGGNWIAKALGGRYYYAHSWWLRSPLPSGTACKVALVTTSGAVGACGPNGNGYDDSIYVRPAAWVKIPTE